MGDLLSSGALLATVLSLFYTLWYPEIRAALDDFKPKQHRVDSTGDIATLTGIIRHRVLPLLLSSVAMTLALLPDGVGVIMRFAAAMAAPRRTYDAVSMLYLLMIGLMVALVVHIAALFWNCRALLRKLRHD